MGLNLTRSDISFNIKDGNIALNKAPNLNILASKVQDLNAISALKENNNNSSSSENITVASTAPSDEDAYVPQEVAPSPTPVNTSVAQTNMHNVSAYMESIAARIEQSQGTIDAIAQAADVANDYAKMQTAISTAISDAYQEMQDHMQEVQRKLEHKLKQAHKHRGIFGIVKAALQIAMGVAMVASGHPGVGTFMMVNGLVQMIASAVYLALPNCNNSTLENLMDHGLFGVFGKDAATVEAVFNIAMSVWALADTLAVKGIQLVFVAFLVLNAASSLVGTTYNFVLELLNKNTEELWTSASAGVLILLENVLLKYTGLEALLKKQLGSLVSQIIIQAVYLLTAIVSSVAMGMKLAKIKQDNAQEGPESHMSKLLSTIKNGVNEMNIALVVERFNSNSVTVMNEAERLPITTIEARNELYSAKMQARADTMDNSAQVLAEVQTTINKEISTLTQAFNTLFSTIQSGLTHRYA